MAESKSNAGRQRPIDILSTDDLERLMQACSRGPTGVRNRALIALQARSDENRSGAYSSR